MVQLKFIIFLGIVLTLIGCSGTVTVIMPEYKNMALSSKQMLVAPYSVKILDTADVISDLEQGNANEVYVKYFEKSFAEKIKIKSRVKQLSFYKGNMPNALVNRDLPTKKQESIRMPLPNDGDIIKTDSINADYVLFISDYSIDHVITPGVYMPNGGFSGGSSDLVHKLSFTIWDNVKGNIVSYGTIESKYSFDIFRKAKSVWEDCVEELAQRILKSSPFRVAPE